MKTGKIAALALLPLAINAFASDRLDAGQAIYTEHCASCHDSGELSAPITGRPADWERRSTLWEAVLFEHANSGYLTMPAKGGSPGLTEYDVDAAAEYMLNISHPRMPED